MREIKFRGWHGITQIMLPPQDLSQNGFYWEWLGKVDVPLMQYTGLKDKNGKEIYEGDIVEIGDGYPQNTKRKIVGFEDGAFTNCHAGYTSGATCEEIEVIGNIHQNHGLLEKNND